MAVAISRPIGPLAVDLVGRTRHHIAIRLIPFLFILYIANYLDRASVAYAALGMSRDLGFSDRVLGMASGVFFISYVALQIPGALVVERWSARRMICLTMIAWGTLTALTALVHTPIQLYVARFLLGGAEAGFFPGVIVYLSHWFVPTDRGKATSNFMGAIPLSFVIGSPVAGWILSRPWLGVQGWRWLFVTEGAPAILLGVVAYFFLTDFPHQAAWLDPEQRQWIQRELRPEGSRRSRAMTAGQALRSRTVLLLAVITLPCYFVFYCFVFWFPTMLKSQSGLSNVQVGLLGAVPYALAFFAMQVNGWHSDKSRERRWHSAVPMFIGAAGLLGVLSPLHSTPFLVLWFSITCLSTTFLPTFWAIPTEILSQSAAAAAVGLVNSVGSVAGFAGPFLFGYLQTRTGSFSLGLGLMMAAAIAAGMLILRIPDGPRHAPPGR